MSACRKSARCVVWLVATLTIATVLVVSLFG